MDDQHFVRLLDAVARGEPLPDDLGNADTADLALAVRLFAARADAPVTLRERRWHETVDEPTSQRRDRSLPGAAGRSLRIARVVRAAAHRIRDRLRHIGPPRRGLAEAALIALAVGLALLARDFEAIEERLSDVLPQEDVVGHWPAARPEGLEQVAWSADESALVLLDQIGGETHALASDERFLYAGLGRRVIAAPVDARWDHLDISYRTPLLDGEPGRIVVDDDRLLVALRERPRLYLLERPLATDAPLGGDGELRVLDSVELDGSVVALADDGPFSVADTLFLLVRGEDGPWLTGVGLDGNRFGAVTRLQSMSGASDLARASGLLYAATERGLAIYDQSASRRPERLSAAAGPLSAVEKIVVDGERAYAAGWYEGEHGLAQLDLTEARQPALSWFDADRAAETLAMQVAAEGVVTLVRVSLGRSQYALRTVDHTGDTGWWFLKAVELEAPVGHDIAVTRVGERGAGIYTTSGDGAIVAAPYRSPAGVDDERRQPLGHLHRPQALAVGAGGLDGRGVLMTVDGQRRARYPLGAGGLRVAGRKEPRAPAAPLLPSWPTGYPAVIDDGSPSDAQHGRPRADIALAGARAAVQLQPQSTIDRDGDETLAAWLRLIDLGAVDRHGAEAVSARLASVRAPSSGQRRTAWHVASDGNRVALSTGRQLWAAEIRDGELTEPTAVLEHAMDVRGLAVDAGHAYVADARSGLRVVDLDRTGDAAQRARLPGAADGVALAEGTATVLGRDALRHYERLDADVLELTWSVRYGALDLPAAPAHVAAAVDTVFLAGDRYVAAVSMLDPTQRVVTEDPALLDGVLDIAAVDGLLLLTTEYHGVLVYDHVRRPYWAQVVIQTDRPLDAGVPTPAADEAPGPIGAISGPLVSYGVTDSSTTYGFWRWLEGPPDGLASLRRTVHTGPIEIEPDGRVFRFADRVPLLLPAGVHVVDGPNDVGVELEINRRPTERELGAMKATSEAIQAGAAERIPAWVPPTPTVPTPPPLVSPDFSSLRRPSPAVRPPAGP